MKCEVSGLYGKDNNKELHFYCEYCNEEMDFNEVRECKVIRQKCSCGNELGSMDFIVNKCLKCERDIK